MFSALLPILAGAQEEPRLESDTDVATAGYFQLRWSSASTRTIELEESATPDFTAPRAVYAGSDKARVMSGKPDGDWYYRAAPTGSDGAYSNIVKVTVRHHSIGRAIGYFTLGAVVFLATLLLIIRGAAASADEDASSGRN